MPYSLSPELDRLVQEQISTGHFGAEEAVLRAALHALRDAETNAAGLRDEIQKRVEKSGKDHAVPLNRPEFKQEARRRSERLRPGED